MCGDLEEEDTEAERLYGAFLQAAHTAVHEAIDHRARSIHSLGRRSRKLHLFAAQSNIIQLRKS